MPRNYVRATDNWIIEEAESLNSLVYQERQVDRHTFAEGDKVWRSCRRAALHCGSGLYIYT